MENFVLTVLGMSFEAAVVICAVLLLRFLFRRLPRSYSHVLWMLVLFRLLCPVTVSSSFSLMPGSGWREETAQGVGSYPEAGENMPGAYAQSGAQTAGVLASQAQASGGQPGSTAQAQPKPQEREEQRSTSKTWTQRAALGAERAVQKGRTIWDQYGIWISLIWLAGAVWLAAAYAVQYMNWREKVRGCGGSQLVRSTERWDEKRFLWKTSPRSVSLVESDRIQEPFVCGVFRPVIYLPAGMGEKERSYILCHEQMHIRHGDPLVRLLWQAALVIHWFDPLVWLAVSLVKKDMEMFCDESVMRQRGNGARKEYAMTLLRFSMKKSGLPFPVAFGESDTESRIHHILTQKKPAVAAGALAVFVIALAAAVLLTDPKAPKNGEDAAAVMQQEDAESGTEGAQEQQGEDSAGLKADGEQENRTDESGADEALQSRDEKLLALARRWAEASSDRDGTALAQMLADPSKMDEYKLEDGSYFYGWSSPWPWNYDYRISYAYEKDEVVIHYYANTSDPRILPWREVLTLTQENGDYLVEDWELNTEAVASKAEFAERFHYEDISAFGGDTGYGYRFRNTPLDMRYPADAAEEWIKLSGREAAAEDTWAYWLIYHGNEPYMADAWQTPEKGAATHLYLEGGRAVEVESPWEDKVCLRWEFDDGMTDVICMYHPYVVREDGTFDTSELWAVEDILEEAAYAEALELYQSLQFSLTAEP